MPVGERRTDEPSIIRQTVQQWPEGGEVIPYMTQFISPPFVGTRNVTGIGSTDIDTEQFKQVPGALDVTTVRSDIFDLPLFFNQVCWTPTEPTFVEKPEPLLPVSWAQHYWHAQVRNTGIIPRDPCWYYYNWIPAFGILPGWDDYFAASLLVEFTCDAVWVGGATYGTTVHVRGTSAEMVILPGTYRWDIQSSTTRVLDEETGLYAYGGVRTWLQGNFTVLEDFTIAPTKVS